MTLTLLIAKIGPLDPGSVIYSGPVLVIESGRIEVAALPGMGKAPTARAGEGSTKSIRKRLGNRTRAEANQGRSPGDHPSLGSRPSVSERSTTSFTCQLAVIPSTNVPALLHDLQDFLRMGRRAEVSQECRQLALAGRLRVVLHAGVVR